MYRTGEFYFREERWGYIQDEAAKTKNRQLAVFSFLHPFS